MSRNSKLVFTSGGKEVLDTYLKVVKKLNRYPTNYEMNDFGVPRHKIRSHFTSLTKLKETAQKHHPEVFENIVQEEIRSPGRQKTIRNKIKEYRRFVVTSVVDSSPVHHKFLKSIKYYCKKNKALLLLMPAGNLNSIDQILANENWIFENTLLNSNLMLNSIVISPKIIDPLKGLGRVAQRNQSQLIASPKQFLEYVAVHDHKMPHALMSTGAITLPLYKDKKRQQTKTDTMATHDHVCGAIVVEVENEKIFHFRQIQAEKSGAFVDLGVYYNGRCSRKMAPEAFVMGDIHVTETDLVALQNWKECIKLTGAKRIFLHDMFSGVSINHHEEYKLINRAILADQNRISLLGELKECAKMLDEVTLWADEVFVVKSNHDEFLSKHYLQKGKYIDEPLNFSLCHKLVGAMMEGNDPLRYGIEKVIGLKRPNKVKWLRRDDSFRIAGIELAAHGDGYAASPAALERAYGNCVVGHSHSARMMRGFTQVGGTVPKLAYAEGPSKWTVTSCAVYSNGARQLINSILGKFRAPKK